MKTRKTVSNIDTLPGFILGIARVTAQTRDCVLTTHGGILSFPSTFDGDFTDRAFTSDLNSSTVQTSSFLVEIQPCQTPFATVDAFSSSFESSQMLHGLLTESLKTTR